MSRNPVKKFLIMAMILIQSFLLIGCEKIDNIPYDSTEYHSGFDTIIDEQIYTQKIVNPYTDDLEDFVGDPSNNFKLENTATVILNDEQTSITNPVADTDIYMENGNLIVDSTKKMTLVLSGTLHGSIIILKTDGKLRLILDGVTIISTSGPAINIQSEKRSFLVLKDDTVNNLTDGTVHPILSNGKTTKGALFSEEQLIISGNGILNITAQYKHAIASDEYIKIISGEINVLSAVNDGIHAKDYIIIDGGTIDINAQTDGMECDEGYIVINGGSLSIHAGNDAIKTSYHGTDTLITPYIQLNNGILHITALFEGIKSASNVFLNQGAMIIDSLDDAISADGLIDINNGLYFLHSLEHQTLDGDLGVTFHGGISVLYSDGDTESIESDLNEVAINGGVVVAAGGLDYSISASQQGYIKMENVLADQSLNIKNELSIITIAFIHSFNHVIISTPDMTPNDNVKIYNSGSVTGTNFYGLYLSGTYTGGVLIDTIPIN